MLHLYRFAEKGYKNGAFFGVDIWKSSGFTTDCSSCPLVRTSFFACLYYRHHLRMIIPKVAGFTLMIVLTSACLVERAASFSVKLQEHTEIGNSQLHVAEMIGDTADSLPPHFLLDLYECLASTHKEPCLESLQDIRNQDFTVSGEVGQGTCPCTNYTCTPSVYIYIASTNNTHYSILEDFRFFFLLQCWAINPSQAASRCPFRSSLLATLCMPSRFICSRRPCLSVNSFTLLTPLFVT